MNIVEAIAKPYLRFNDKVGTQDFLKALALLTMIIDHVGLYFFPDYVILRIIGRVSMPIWLFFVGYNFKPSKQKLDRIFYLGVFLEIFSYLKGYNDNIIPLNILFTIICSKIILNYYLRYIGKEINLYEWFFIACSCLVLSTLSNCFVEYGSLAFLCAIWGYNCRNDIGNKVIQGISVYVIICAVEIELFHFNLMNSIIFGVIMLPTAYFLYSYKDAVLNIDGVSKYIINISARYSLYLYVAHLSLILCAL
jgi:hypothetical protein